MEIEEQASNKNCDVRICNKGLGNDFLFANEVKENWCKKYRNNLKKKKDRHSKVLGEGEKKR